MCMCVCACLCVCACMCVYVFDTPRLLDFLYVSMSLMAHGDSLSLFVLQRDSFPQAVANNVQRCLRVLERRTKRHCACFLISCNRHRDCSG